MARYGDDNNRDRWREEDRERSSWRSGRPGSSERDDERGFFERAGEEIRSWFSDEDDRSGQSAWERDREMGRRGSREQYRGGSGWQRDEGRGNFSDRDRYGRGGSDFEDRSSFGGMAQGGYGRSGGSDRNQGRGGYGPSRGGGEWRSMTDRDRSSMGGYGEDRGNFRGGNRGRSQGWGEADRGRRSESNDRDQGSLGYSSGMSGTLGGFGNQTFGSGQDDHYRSWRDRQLAELDRDYEDYCREREQNFHSDYDSWRRDRAARGQAATSSAAPSDLGSTPNAGVGTTTSSVTGTAGTGSAIGGGSPGSSPALSDATDQTARADTGAGSGGGRSGSRSKS